MGQSEVSLILVFTLVFLHHQCQLSSGWGGGEIDAAAGGGADARHAKVMERENRGEVKREWQKI